ncbi:MAG: type II secretion system protein [Pirellulales bacterium]|nr:type II secretion system protein [Pirellulales bacterium]
MARRGNARRAMTLFELIAVVMIIGLVSVMAATRFSNTTLADIGAQGFSRRVALDCSQARRRAIATGDNHLLRFTFSGGNATQYALYRKVSGVATLVDDIHAVPENVTVTTGGVTDVEFQFTGEALASYTITVTAPDRNRTVTIPQVTGRAFLQ